MKLTACTYPNDYVSKPRPFSKSVSETKVNFNLKLILSTFSLEWVWISERTGPIQVAPKSVACPSRFGSSSYVFGQGLDKVAPIRFLGAVHRGPVFSEIHPHSQLKVDKIKFKLTYTFVSKTLQRYYRILKRQIPIVSIFVTNRPSLKVFFRLHLDFSALSKDIFIRKKSKRTSWMARQMTSGPSFNTLAFTVNHKFEKLSQPLDQHSASWAYLAFHFVFILFHVTLAAAAISDGHGTSFRFIHF